VRKSFELVVLNSAGELRTVRFSSEEELISFLKVTYATEAPISFNHADGSAVDRETMDQIHSRFFGETRQSLTSPICEESTRAVGMPVMPRAGATGVVLADRC